MDEAEWDTAADPETMLESLPHRASDRKLRLFLVACFRLVWEFIRDPRTHDAVLAGELLADGRISEEARLKVEAALWDARDEFLGDVECSPDLEGAVMILSREPCDASYIGHRAKTLNYFAMDEEMAFHGLAEELQIDQCDLLRDIFGNPFRPLLINLSWLTPTVVALAAGIYADHAFDRMPILADALEEAGCGHAEVLRHCRGDGPHARGCWVVDALLGRT